MSGELSGEKLQRAAPTTVRTGLAESSYRVGAVGVLIAVAAVFGFVTSHVMVFVVKDEWAINMPIAYLRVIHGAELLLSAGLIWAARSRRFEPERLLRLGLAYEVLVCFLISFADHLRAGEDPVLGAVSPLCIALVLFATMLPAAWKQRVVTTIASICMWAIALGVVMALPGTKVGAGQIITQAGPGILGCAMLALIAARVIQGYRSAADEAREKLKEMGSYRLIELLGKGGMGEVWRAEHNLLQRPAAVKVIKPDVLKSKDPTDVERTMQRFEREARATSQLNSLHTVDLYDFGTTDDGSFYYVMQLLDGMDLQTMVSRYGPLPPERVVHLLIQACDSLGEAHAAGMVHRDVKPANFFVCRLGETEDVLKVLDFGLVLAVSEEGERVEPRLTMQGHVSGTPPYMAPEAGFENKEVDRRADIYALGCMAYFMLTGLLVFKADTAVAMILAHMRERPEPPSTRVSTPIPAELEAVIMSCLEKEPNARPQTAAELATRIRGCPTQGAWTQERAHDWWRRVRGPSDG